MKKLALITTILFQAFSMSASAGVEDFNSIIEENSVAQKKISKDLQAQLKTKDLGKTSQPDFKSVAVEVLGKNTSENIAVQSSDSTASRASKAGIHLDLERSKFRRLSQELKDIR